MSTAEAKEAEARKLISEAAALDTEEMEQLGHMKVCEEAQVAAEKLLAEAQWQLLQVSLYT